MLPSGSEFPDEMSSMNSSIYQDKGRRGPTGMNINTEVHLSDTSNTSFDNEAVARVVAVVEKQESIDQPVPEEDEYRPGKATSCIPLWIKRAPFWLKLMLVASLSLLVAASVLVGLGVGMSKDDGPTAASQNVQSPTGDLTRPFDQPLTATAISFIPRIQIATFPTSPFLTGKTICWITRPSTGIRHHFGVYHGKATAITRRTLNLFTMALSSSVSTWSQEHNSMNKHGRIV